ncbi:MAG: GAF domain-containing protein [Chloroflexi bacterium]|nr:MAG: GAF domain-containing protein [Chloroflexota bacterium]
MPRAKILIVEDELIVANNLKINLEQIDYHVPAIAASGVQAVEKTLEHWPDLILMDIKLRGSMDGIEAARQIREQVDVPIIFMTAYTDDATFQRAKQTEPAGYVLKPFEMRDMHSTIEMALYKHEADRKLKQSEARYRRLFEQSSALLADTEALYRFSLSIATTENLPDLLQNVVNSVAETLPAFRVTLLTLNFETRQIEQIITNRPVSGLQLPDSVQLPDTFEELEEGLTGWVVRHKKPALSPKNSPDPRESLRVRQRRQANKVGAILVVPLQYHAQVFGTLTAANQLYQPDFDQRDVKLLSAMANQTAVAIENARLLENTRQRVTELEAVHQATLSLTSSLKLPTVLTGILQSVVTLLPNTIKSVIYLYQNGELIFAADKGREQVGNTYFPPPRTNGTTYTVAQTGQTVVIADIQNDHRYKNYHPEWKVAMVSLPLKVGHRVRGVMNVFHHAPHPWSDSELRVLRLLGDQAAVAIENARLYEQTRQDAATKAALLETINHRVKNNLSTIIGMLYAIQHCTADGQTINLDDLIGRIEALATVHNLLAAHEWQPLPLSELAERVIDSAIQSYPDVTPPICVTVQPSPVTVTPKCATNLTLILHELATNVLKHVAPVAPTPNVDVNIRAGGHNVVNLTFCDNGPGYPQAVLDQTRQQVGLFLVNTVITNGLRGVVHLRNHNGAVADFHFAPIIE